MTPFKSAVEKPSNATAAAGDLGGSNKVNNFYLVAVIMLAIGLIIALAVIGCMYFRRIRKTKGIVALPLSKAVVTAPDSESGPKNTPAPSVLETEISKRYLLNEPQQNETMINHNACEEDQVKRRAVSVDDDSS